MCKACVCVFSAEKVTDTSIDRVTADRTVSDSTLASSPPTIPSGRQCKTRLMPSDTYGVTLK